MQVVTAVSIPATVRFVCDVAVEGDLSTLAIPSIVLGLCLTVLGVVSYFATGRVSMTALIPVPFGVIFMLLGVMAQNPKLRMHAMHAAATLALLAIIFTAKGIVTVVQMWGGAAIDHTKGAAAVAKATMAILCIVFLVFCINSFVQVRRARRNADV